MHRSAPVVVSIQRRNYCNGAQKTAVMADSVRQWSIRSPGQPYAAERDIAPPQHNDRDAGVALQRTTPWRHRPAHHCSLQCRKHISEPGATTLELTTTAPRPRSKVQISTAGSRARPRIRGLGFCIQAGCSTHRRPSHYRSRQTCPRRQSPASGMGTGSEA